MTPPQNLVFAPGAPIRINMVYTCKVITFIVICTKLVVNNYKCTVCELDMPYEEVFQLRYQ